MMLNKKVRHILSSSRLLFIMAAILIFMAIYEPSFFNTDNLVNIISHASINGIVAVGMTPLMIAKAFDISVGSIMVLSGVISIMLVNKFDPVTAILIGTLSGILLGWFNGFLVARLKINSFISTLGTMVIYQGIAFVITNMQPITTESAAFQKFATVEVFGVPILIVYFIIVMLLIWFILRFTGLGKNSYAIGGNEAACRLMGINVERYITIFFIISGLGASFAGVVLSSKLNAASAVFGENVSLLVIAGIVLGGVHLTGGVGTISGVIQGIILIGLLDNITIYLGLFGYYQMFFRSLILIGVVIFDVIYIKQAANRLQKEELMKTKSLVATQ